MPNTQQQDNNNSNKNQVSKKNNWLFLAIFILLPIIATSVWTLNQGDYNPQYLPIKDEIILNLPDSQLEIEASITKVPKKLFEQSVFTGNIEDLNNYSQADLVIAPKFLLQNDLTVKNLQKNDIEFKNQLNSFVLPDSILNDSSLEQVPEITQSLAKEVQSSPINQGINIHLKYSSLTDRSKKILVQLLSEIKQSIKPKILTVTLDTTILDDLRKPSIEALADHIFVFCESSNGLSNNCQFQTDNKLSLLVKTDTKKTNSQNNSYITNSYITSIGSIFFE